MGDGYDYLFKFVLVGDSGVGKSNVLSRFRSNEFNLKYEPTIGVEFKTITHEIEDDIVEMQIWDKAGQESYRAITSAYYRSAVGVIVLYDITCRDSFEHVQLWLQEITDYADPDIVIMLVGNKVDVDQSCRMVTEEEGRSLAEKEGLLFCETSALDATNIELAFATLIHKIWSNMFKKPKTTSSQSTSSQPSLPAKLLSHLRLLKRKCQKK